MQRLIYDDTESNSVRIKADIEKNTEFFDEISPLGLRYHVISILLSTLVLSFRYFFL